MIKNLSLDFHAPSPIHKDIDTFPEEVQKGEKQQSFDMINFYEVEKVVNVLKEGGLILYPTDTIWGIGCDATNPEAVTKVFQLKNRPAEKSFILLVNSIEMLRNYVEELHPRLETLLLYHERPLTVIYDKPKNLPEEVLHHDGSIAIRITFDKFCSQIIGEFGKPIVSTSANIAGAPFPTHFGAISSEIIEGIDYVVRHRQKDRKMGEPSVIVKLSEDAELVVIRG